MVLLLNLRTSYIFRVKNISGATCTVMASAVED